MEDRRMLVFYLGIGEMNSHDIPRHVQEVQNRFFTTEFFNRNNCEIFMIPTREVNSRIECINPIYITDEKLIEEHERMMKECNDSIYKFTNEQPK